MVSDGKGGAIFIWSEVSIPPNRGVLCQRINKYGQLGGLTTRITDSPSLSTPDFLLHQNYPNPFNSTTSIRYQLPQKCHVSIAVYNMLGQKIRTLLQNQFHQAGIHAIPWDGKNELGLEVGSGMYLYQLHAGDFVDSKKLVVMK